MREVIERLTEELKALEHELRIELPKEIRTAVAMGDLRENAEYHAALQRQAFVRARIGQLRERLGELRLINLSQIPKGKVGLGSTVTLLDRDTEQEVTYELVIPEVADLNNGLISVASPIGRSLMGREEGDMVTIEVPSGRKRFELLELRTIHDKDGSGTFQT
jgi:transcription elongation factor GreA